MKDIVNASRSTLKYLLRAIGIGATGATMVSLSTSSEVFASQFLNPTTPMQSPDMVYSPELQLMVKPGTDDPIFKYTATQPPKGKDNGEYMVAPLVPTTSPPPPPPPPPVVTPGGGPNGPGPHAD